MSRRNCFDVRNQSAIAGTTVLFLAAFMLCGQAGNFFFEGEDALVSSSLRRLVQRLRCPSVKHEDASSWLVSRSDS